jgi:hypothetical protein
MFALGACSDKKKETKLQSRISELETQVDECQNGADKLLAKIKISFENQEFNSVKTMYAEFQNRHPETEEFKEAKSLHDNVVQLEEEYRLKAEKLAEEKRKEAESKVEKKRQEKLKALNKLKKKYDDVSGITWYRQPYFTHYTNTNLISIYMGDTGTSRWLRLMISYKGDSWIFFEKAYLSYDGNIREIIFNKYDDKKTENDSGVWDSPAP